MEIRCTQKFLVHKVSENKAYLKILKIIKTFCKMQLQSLGDFSDTTANLLAMNSQNEIQTLEKTVHRED